MFSGPMFRHEYRSATRKRRPFLLRITFAAVLGLIALMIGLVLYSSRSGDSPQVKTIYFGRALFIATVCLEVLFLTFFVSAYVGTSIAEEREKDTLGMLLLTRLRPSEIVATKAVARWLPAVNLTLAGLPALVAAAWLSGLEVEAGLAMTVLLSTSAFMASLAILASARREQAATARAQALAWTFGWLLGPPFLSILPVASGSLWGDLLLEVKRLCILVAPSSPLSLATDTAWFHRPEAVSLEGRVALMVGLQAAFGLLAVGLAAAGLQPRERNPNWLDPTRGFRPRCGDDPIFWREYELPIRKGSGSLLALRLRLVWILVRAILMNLLGLLAALLTVAVPIGLVVATLYYGLAAFRELADVGRGGPFVERERFNLLIRAATGLLGFLPSIFQPSAIAGRITTERDKKTWEAFLMTPLEAREILRSKARVVLHGVAQAAWPLLVLWALGIACGVVTPIGVALTAVDLALVLWAGTALGLYLGFRPGTTSSANNWAAMAMLAALLAHAPLLGALLASPPQLAAAATWGIGLRRGLALAGLAVAAGTALFAWFLTRRTIARFDEWAGRPIAGSGDPGGRSA